MKKLLGMLVCLMVCYMMTAAPVDKATALQSATSFMQQKGWNVSKQPRLAPRKAKAQAAEKNYVYLFNSDNGFVIVSGDDQTEPILGYVEGAQFNEDEMPENMKWWIGEYERQIKYLQDHNIQQVQYVLDAPAVSQLTTTDWSQGDPYNLQCPKVGTYNCMTGCLATALAQLMKYHEWSQEATTEIPGYRTETNRISMQKLPATTFDWANMKNSYRVGVSTQAQKDAVAKLMLYCGQANYMDYDTSSSGASESGVVNSLVNYFGYDESAQLTERRDITVEEWENMVYFELANNRPVFYCGQSTGGGHAFLCDGYDGNGLFHISWGWEYNNYFNSWCRLSILNPATTSAIGASTTEDGFTYGQSIVRGVRRPGDAGEVAPLMLQASVEDTWVYGSMARVYYVSNLAKTYQFDIALAILDDSNNPTIISIETNKNITPLHQNWDYAYSDYDLSASQFGGDGTYRLAMLCRKSGTTEWVPMFSYDMEYFKATVSGSKVTLSKVYNDGTSLAAENMQFTDAVSTKEDCEFTAEITNTGTEEYSGELYCFQSKTTSKGQAVSVAGAYVQPGATEKVYFYFTPLSTEDLNVWICTDDKGNNIIGQITISPTPKDVYDLSIVSSSVVTDPLNVTVKVKNASSEAYNRNISATIYRADTNQPLFRKVTKTVEIPAGGTTDVVYTSLPGVDKQYNYYLVLSYYEDSKTTELTAFPGRIDIIFNYDPTGIRSIENSELKIENSDYYNLAGQRVDSNYKGIVIRKGKKVVR